MCNNRFCWPFTAGCGSSTVLVLVSTAKKDILGVLVLRVPGNCKLLSKECWEKRQHISHFLLSVWEDLEGLGVTCRVSTEKQHARSESQDGSLGSGSFLDKSPWKSLGDTLGEAWGKHKGRSLEGMVGNHGERELNTYFGT